MTQTPIKTSRRGHVLEVTIDRPKANAIDLATSQHQQATQVSEQKGTGLARGGAPVRTDVDPHVDWKIGGDVREAREGRHRAQFRVRFLHRAIQLVHAGQASFRCLIETVCAQG